MGWLVQRETGNLGPYSPAELRTQIASGHLLEVETARDETTGAADAIAQVIANDDALHALRLAHWKHENNLRGFGLLFYLASAGTLIVGWENVEKDLIGGWKPVALGAAFLAGSAFLFWIARDLRQLRSRVRITATLVAIPGLFEISLGTILNTYLLYLLHSKKGRFILSKEYQPVIAATSQFVYPNSSRFWVYLGLLIALAAAVNIWARFSH